MWRNDRSWSSVVVTAGCLIAMTAVIVDALHQRTPQQQQRTPKEYATFLEGPGRVVYADRVAQLHPERVRRDLSMRCLSIR
jgi:hypothetical protein